jgi:RHS repeat-associated protein
MCTPVSYERGRAVAYIVFFLLAVTAALTQTKSAKKAVEDKPLLQYAKLPVYFEQNVGQTDAKVRFLSRGRGYGLFLTPTEAVLALSTREPAPKDMRHLMGPRSAVRPSARKHSVVRLSFQGTQARSAVEGVEELEGKANYLIGNDPKKWRTDVPLFSKVRCSQIYQGIDVVYYGSQGRLEYDLLLDPKADPAAIRFRTEGADRVTLAKSGDLQLQTATGTVVLRKPDIYQVGQHGRKRVKGGYVLRAKSEIGIAIAAYDRTKQLIVDPGLEYSTYLGGSGVEYEYGKEIGVDTHGNVYLEGLTTSSDFPPSTTIGTTKGNGSDILFVTKLNPTGTALVYSTYLGGTGNNVPYYNGPDEPTGLAVDANGYAYATGVTVAPDFPVTSTAFQSTLATGVGVEGFLSKLSADGQSLLYSTYLGGNNANWLQAINVDANQNAYLTGWTTASSPAFPLTPGAFQTVNRSPYGDAFVSKLDTTKSGAASLVYSTLIGGSTTATIGDMGMAVAADSSGKIYIVGLASSTDFPVTSTAYQSVGGNPPYGNVFLSEFDPTQSGSASLLYSTYLGGTGRGADIGYALALDQAGKVHIGGLTDSVGFPGNGCGAAVAFIAEFDTTKTNAASLVYSQCFGTAGLYSSVQDIAVDPAGNTYVGGATTDNSFPLTPDAVQSTTKSNGVVSGFVTIFSTNASTILYSTYFGSSNASLVQGVTLDPSNNIYITGRAEGIDLPTTQQLFQPTLQGTTDLFVAKFGGILTPTITSLSSNSGLVGTPLTISGLNFGSSQGTVTFNGVAASPTSWSPGSIVVPVPSGATTGSVVVTAGGVASNGTTFTVLSGFVPIVLVQHAKQNGGTNTKAVLAFGANNVAGNWIGVCVRASGTNQNLSMSDTNGNLYRQAVSVNETGGANTLAVFYAENIAAGPNTVAVSDTVSSNLEMVILEYSGLALYGSLDGTASAIGNSTSPASGSTTTTANGDLLLGSIMSASGTTFTAGTGYTQEDFVPGAPSTQLIAEDETQAQSGSASATAALAASGYWAAALAAFKVGTITTGTSPTITTISPVTGNVGTAVTISGYNFGAVRGASTVAFNGTPANPSFWSDGTITVAAPTGSTEGYIVVTVGGVASNGVWFAQPSITSTSPTSGAVGSSLTINGAHFGATTGVVKFDGVPVATYSSWATNKVIVTIPAGATRGPLVVVNSNGIVSNEFTFTVTGAVPSVIGISPTSGSTGTSVTISGSNFGTSQGSSTVTFNGVPAGTATQWGASTVKIPVPAGATTGNVVVTVGGQSDLQTNIFSVSGTASVSGMLPTRGGVGAEVTITGSNLGSSGTVKFNGVTATPWSWSSTLITVPVPPGATAGTVMVTAGSTQISAGTFDVRSAIPATATEFSYDAMGRVIQKTICTPMNCGTGSTPQNLTVTYDLAGDETSVSFNGPIINYQRDAVSRVTQVTSTWVDSQHPATLATVDSANGYWPTGELHKMLLANNLTESNVYNSRIQPCRINVNSSGTLLSNCSDALPAGNFQDLSAGFSAGSADNGNLAAFTGTGQQNFNRSYTYDTLNRIQTMSAPGDQCSGLSWTIDPWGNRTAQTGTGGNCFSPLVTVNAANQLTGGPYGYDLSGNLLNDGNHAYAYDAEGRVTTVDSGATASYVYDAFGQRVGKNVGNVDSEYVYDQDGKLNSVFGNGTFQRGYVYIGGQPLAEYFENKTYFVHGDHLGSTRLLTRLDQSIREKDDYYPYGEPITTVSTGDILKFTGKERDTESGLDMFDARYYTSAMGRFMTPDDGSDQGADDPSSWNLYSYTRDSPMSNTDPTGRCTFKGGKYLPDEVSDCSEIEDKTVPPTVTVTVAMPQPLTKEQIHQLSDEITGAGKFPWKDILFFMAGGKIAGMVGDLRGIQITGLNAGAAEATADQVAEQIASGHAFGKHAAEIGATSKPELKTIVKEIVANANATNDVRQLSGGRIAYWDDTRKAVVIFNPSAVDRGTVFVPKQGRYYFDVVLK